MLDRMQKGLSRIGLLFCAAVVCRANEAPFAMANVVDTNAIKRVLLTQLGFFLGGFKGAEILTANSTCQIERK